MALGLILPIVTRLIIIAGFALGRRLLRIIKNVKYNCNLIKLT